MKHVIRSWIGGKGFTPMASSKNIKPCTKLEIVYQVIDSEAMIVHINTKKKAKLKLQDMELIEKIHRLDKYDS